MDNCYISLNQSEVVVALEKCIEPYLLAHPSARFNSISHVSDLLTTSEGILQYSLRCNAAVRLGLTLGAAASRAGQRWLQAAGEREGLGITMHHLLGSSSALRV